MRDAGFDSAMSTRNGVVTRRVSAPAAAFATPTASVVAPHVAVRAAILPFTLAASIISGLLLLTRPAARFVERAAGLTIYDIA